MTFRVLLAARSPLYAPIYFAWSEAPPAIRRRLRLSFAHELPSRPDALVESTLSRYDPDEPVLLAVGDLVRLKRYVALGDGLYEPIITGGLVDRTCLWLLDGFQGRAGAEAEPPLSQLDASTLQNLVVLSHPKHMTTYHVANSHMHTLLNGVSGEIVQPVVPPGEEGQYHSVWSRCLRGRHKRVTYMSADISLHLGDMSRGHRILHDYSKDPAYRGLSMTGMFTSEKVHAEESRLIRDFQGLIGDAIKTLDRDPDEIAWTLYRNAELLRQVGFDADYKHLARLTDILRDVRGYATDLALSENQLERAIHLRKECDQQEGTELAATLFRLRADYVPLPPSDVQDALPTPSPIRPHSARWWYGKLVATRAELARAETPRVFERGHRWSDWPLRLGYLGATLFNAFLLWDWLLTWRDARLASAAQAWGSGLLASGCFFWIAVTDGHRFRQQFRDVPFLASGVMVCSLLLNIAIILKATGMKDSGGLLGNFVVEVLVIWACVAARPLADAGTHWRRFVEQVRRTLARHRSALLYRLRL